MFLDLEPFSGCEGFEDFYPRNVHFEKEMTNLFEGKALNMEVSDKFVRVKAFEPNTILTVDSVQGDCVLADDGTYYSQNPDWTRLATDAEIEVGHRIDDMESCQ